MPTCCYVPVTQGYYGNSHGYQGVFGFGLVCCLCVCFVCCFKGTAIGFIFVNADC